MPRVRVTIFEGSVEDVGRLLKLRPRGKPPPYPPAPAVLMSRSPSLPENTPRSTELTPRELAIGRLLLQGLTRKEIARRLEIDAETVKSHTGNLYRKLGIHKATHLRAHKTLFE